VLANQAPFPVDGFTFYDATWVDNPTSTCSVPAPIEAATVFPCGGVAITDTAGTKRMGHFLGDRTTKFTCIDEAVAPADTAISATPTLAAFSSPQQAGGEVVGAPTVGGTYVVPAAAGGTPGSIVVYVTRPVAAARSLPLTWNGVSASSRYEFQESWLFIYKRGWGAGSQGGCVDALMFEPAVGGRYLSGAAETLSGSLQFSTISVNGAFLGGELNASAPLSLTRTVTTH